MFCPNCGKYIKDTDNFCRYCGADLREQVTQSYIENISDETSENIEQPSESSEVEIFPVNNNREEEPQKEFVYEGEELVLYEVKKHLMSLFWPMFLTPLFIVYFWIIFLNTHSFMSWVIVVSMLILIIYPVIRYKSDSIVITTKSAHIKMGAVKPINVEIPLEKTTMFDVTQSAMGRLLDYGTVTFCANSEKYDYPYIKYPEDIQYIIDNPKRFVQEALEEN